VKILWHQLRPIAAATLMMAALVLAVRWTIPGSDFADSLARLVLAVALVASSTPRRSYGSGVRSSVRSRGSPAGSAAVR